MNFINALFERVWQASLSATVLVGLAMLVLVCFGRKLPAWSRYGVWVLVVLRLVIPVVPPASFSIWNLTNQGEKPMPSLIAAQPAGYQTAIQQSDTLRHEKVQVLPIVWMFGTIVWWGLAVLAHQQLARWLRKQEVCTDARILALLDQARRAFTVRATIAVVCNDRFEVPAVFGVFRPKLLLPAKWAKGAADEELFGILLHEMAHVKCRDALVNCVCIFVRSLHWFNPAVWYAFRRLRRERELFCDALVLACLRPEQRSIYGAALLKVAAQISGAAPPTTLIPVLQHKPEIHRRIHMIAKYKSTPWLISAGVALLLIAIAGLTFTRAADKQTPAPAAASPDQTKPLDLLEKEIARQQELVRKLQAQADELQLKLNNQFMDVSPGPSEAVQKMEAQQIEARAEFSRIFALYEYLSKLSREDLKRSISTASPDAQLSELMQHRNIAEQKLADLIEAHTSAHPEVKRITRVLAQINKQIEDRIDGIMKGLEARRDAEKARLEGTEKSLLTARQRHVENVVQSRPYQQLLQELRAQEEILQRLRMRLAEERIDRALEEARRK